MLREVNYNWSIKRSQFYLDSLPATLSKSSQFKVHGKKFSSEAHGDRNE